MIGQNVNHYEVTAKLGEGGMGEVYLATDSKLDRQVALKILPHHFSSDAESRSRFQREARALAALNHPNIVAVYDVSEHDSRPFIAMEFVEGQTLKDMLAESDVDYDKALEMTAQAADGLSAAHQRGIVHRDIKSENISFSTEGRVKIMDFGLATWRGVTKVTAEGSTLGTRAYMSPEQSTGQDVDHRTDLWSIGVVLYELITGRLPFDGSHDAAIAYAITNEDPEPLARYKSGSPDELQRIVSKCLAKNPDERYQSAADLATDIRAARSDYSKSSSAVASPPSRLRKTVVSVSAVIVVAAVAVVVTLMWNPLQQATEGTNSARIMLAVLPFENLGPEDQEYFADGMTEEITSRLASISGLGVISRTSAMRFKNSELSLQEIATELGVDFVLEGTIRWDQSGDTSLVLITPQLIRALDDTHMWADRIERPLDRIFAVQASIAERVVSALDITLLDPERRAIADEPTGNVEAYDYYLRGIDIINQHYYGQWDDLFSAIPLFEQAIVIDSGYAQAYAALSRVQSRIYSRLSWWEPEHVSDTLLANARAFAEKAIMLEPDLADGHLAMGYYYHSSSGKSDSALEQFQTVARSQPNNSDALLAIGLVKERQGEWLEAYRAQQQALNLDPMSNEKRRSFAKLCIWMRRFAEAIEILDRGIILYPEHLGLYISKVDAKLRMTMKFEERQAIYHSGAMYHPGLEFAYRDMAAWEARDYELLLSLAPLGSPDLETWADSLNLYSDLADLHSRANRPEISRAYADSALALTEGQSDSVIAVLPGMGQLYVRLERKEKAIAWGKTRDNPVALLFVYIDVGEHGRALDLLDRLLTEASRVSVTDLQFNPHYDPLRDNPRFQELIDRGDVVL